MLLVRNDVADMNFMREEIPTVKSPTDILPSNAVIPIKIYADT